MKVAGCETGDVIETGSTVGGFMFATTLFLAAAGAVAAPFTGGASLALTAAEAGTLATGAAVVGGVSGAGAAVARKGMGKECRSPALGGIQTGTAVLKTVTGGL
tara:strand:+ start:562 stop:873 length:312 start_codon:yes stop_codon:yes gene_type:complete